MGASLVPCERSAAEVLLRLERNIVCVDRNFFDVLEVLLGGKIQNLNTFLSSNYKPVKLLREENAVDWSFTITGSQELSLDEVPNHDLAITRARGEVGGTVNHIKSVDLSFVANKGVVKGHVKIVPNLDGLVPRSSHANCWLSSVVEFDAGDGISVLIFVNSVLAL